MCNMQKGVQEMKTEKEIDEEINNLKKMKKENSENYSKSIITFTHYAKTSEIIDMMVQTLQWVKS